MPHCHRTMPKSAKCSASWGRRSGCHRRKRRSLGLRLTRLWGSRKRRQIRQHAGRRLRLLESRVGRLHRHDHVGRLRLLVAGPTGRARQHNGRLENRRVRRMIVRKIRRSLDIRRRSRERTAGIDVVRRGLIVPSGALKSPAGRHRTFGAVRLATGSDGACRGGDANRHRDARSQLKHVLAPQPTITEIDLLCIDRAGGSG